MTQNHPKFKDAGATIEFVRYFNNLFDIFNSRSMLSKTKFKNPLSNRNNTEIFSYLKQAVEYIKGPKLKVGRTRRTSRSILMTANRTAFRGYLINIESLTRMYEEFMDSSQVLKIFPTFMLSQDFVELFFCKIRSLHGYNDNPTVVQFISAYRKLLSNGNILASYDANVKVFKSIIMTSFTDILSVSSKRPALADNWNEDYIAQTIMDNEEDIQSELALMTQNNKMDYLSEKMSSASVAGIANLIEQRILGANNAYCKMCQFVLVENRKIGSNLIVSSTSVTPCKSTYEVCKKVNDYLKLMNQFENEQDFNFNAIYLTIFQKSM